MVELLIVVAILGILLNLVAPTLVAEIQRGHAARVIEDFLAVRTAALDYRIDFGAYPDDVGLGVAPPELDRTLGNRLLWSQGALYAYEWENWLDDESLSATGIGIGFSVVTDNERLLVRIADRYDGPMVRVSFNRLTFMIESAGFVTDEEDDDDERKKPKKPKKPKDKTPPGQEKTPPGQQKK
jgi:type II secretory pathway pseudopilin PulG